METRIRWSADARKSFNRMVRVFSRSAQISIEEARGLIYDKMDAIERGKKSRKLSPAFREADYPRVKRG